MATNLTNSFKMVVSEKGLVDGKTAYVARGSVDVFYPLLADLGLVAEIKATSEEGFPLYADERAQLAFDALLAMVKSAARNKLTIVNGAVALKENATIATTLEQLLESGSGNSGLALQQRREFLALAKAFLATTGKSQKIQEAVYGFMASPDTLALIDDDKKARTAVYLVDFVSSLTPEQRNTYARRINAIDEACNATSALDDAEY